MVDLVMLVMMVLLVVRLLLFGSPSIVDGPLQTGHFLSKMTLRQLFKLEY